MTSSIIPSLLAAASAAAAFLGGAVAYLEFRARKTREFEPDLWIDRDPEKYKSPDQPERVWTLQLRNYGRSPARNTRYAVFTASHVARDVFGRGFIEPGEAWEIVFDQISSKEELQGVVWCEAIDGTWYGREVPDNRGNNRGTKFGRREPSEEDALSAFGLSFGEEGRDEVEGWSRRPEDEERDVFNLWARRLDEAANSGAPPEAIEQAKTHVLAQALILSAQRR